MPIADAAGLAGRRALVTGAASGIGASCAVRLARAGAHVVAVDVDAGGVKTLARDHPGIEPVTCDLADLDTVDLLPADIDVLVNNAGLQHVAAVHEFPPDRFSLILRVMLEAPFRLSAAPCRTCTRAAGGASSTSPARTGCGPAPTRPPT